MCPKEDDSEFGSERASNYDDKWARLSAMKDALHLFVSVALSDLPKNAHILCVGAGTGAELFSLASAFEGWRFTAVEPASAMLQICREKAAKAGIASRCEFHEGFLGTLPRDTEFDGATCLLVSQFLTDSDERSAFFSDIASRLVSRAVLVSADITGDMNDSSFNKLLNLWAKMMRYADIPEGEVESMIESLGSTVAVMPPSEMESMLRRSGFAESTVIFQTLLVRAWLSRTA